MGRFTEEMKIWLFNLAHNNLSDDDILKGFIKHYVLYEFVISNVQQDILYHTNYGENGVRTAIVNIRRVLGSLTGLQDL